MLESWSLVSASGLNMINRGRTSRRIVRSVASHDSEKNSNLPTATPTS